MKSTITKFVTFLIICLGIISPELKALAQSQGPNNPGSQANSASGGSVAWITPANSAASDNSYTTSTNGISNFLNVSNFGFSIPLTATITGIVAEIERKATPVNPVSSGTWASFTPPTYTSGTTTSVYGSTSYSYNLPVASATNNRRLLVVTVGIENVDNFAPMNPSITFGTVTYNGTAMTLATSNSMASASTSNNVAVYYLVESGLPATTGAGTLVVNKTINGEAASEIINPEQYAEVVGVNLYTNVNQSTPVSAVSQTSATSPITSPTISNVRNGDYLVAAIMNNSPSPASVTPETGYTEHFEISNNNAGSSGAILEVESKSLSGISGTPYVTISATASGASRLVMGAISVNAARVYDGADMAINSLGFQTGTDHSVGPANTLSNAWPDADTYQSYGVSTDLWGASWSPLTINSSNFGLSIQVDASYSIASIDNVRLTVYYSTPLSVTLQSFTATKTDKQVITESSFFMDDHKNYLFTLERASADLNFTNVSSTLVTGKHELQTISIVDANPHPGTNYYRIKMHGDEKTEYSTIEKINFDSDEAKVLIYPNPSYNGYLEIESDRTIISLTLYDINGNSIPLSISSFGSTKYKIDSIPFKGFCTLEINTDSGIINKKIILN